MRVTFCAPLTIVCRSVFFLLLSRVCVPPPASGAAAGAALRGRLPRQSSALTTHSHHAPEIPRADWRHLASEQ